MKFSFVKEVSSSILANIKQQKTEFFIKYNVKTLVFLTFLKKQNIIRSAKVVKKNNSGRIIHVVIGDYSKKAYLTVSANRSRENYIRNLGLVELIDLRAPNKSTLMVYSTQTGYALRDTLIKKKTGGVFLFKLG